MDKGQAQSRLGHANARRHTNTGRADQPAACPSGNYVLNLGRTRATRRNGETGSPLIPRNPVCLRLATEPEQHFSQHGTDQCDSVGIDQISDSTFLRRVGFGEERSPNKFGRFVGARDYKLVPLLACQAVDLTGLRFPGPSRLGESRSLEPSGFAVRVERPFGSVVVAG